MNLQSEQQSRCFDACKIYQRASGNTFPLKHQYQNDDGLAFEDQRKKEEVDELLAQALTGLTCEERQHHQEVLHVVDEKITEEASFIDKALQDLELYLLMIKEGSMYQVAEQMDAEYVHNRAFLIMFLRANEYDPKASADHVIRFFQSKFDLFGKSKLAKDITLGDLGEDGIAALESGWVQHAGCDQSGRQVWVYFGGVAPVINNLLGVLRSQFFFAMRASQSEELQLGGSVSIWWANGNLKNRTKGKGYNEVYSAGRALPLKKCAIHVCVDDVYQYALLSVSVKVMKGIVRARTRVHVGTHVECRYQLTSFGILSTTLPLDDRGGLDLSRHRVWMHNIAVEDNVPYGPSLEASGTVQTTNKPTDNDVLFMSGKYVHHGGNKRLRSIVQDYIQSYDLGNDETKRWIVATVIGKMQSTGGRFLKQTGDSTTTWEEVPPDELRKKIMQTFRNRRRLASVPRQNTNGANGVLITGEPFPCDVIFGRVSQRTPGSELLNRLIMDNFEEYETLDRGEKMKLVEAVVMQPIQSQGGRFLQPDSLTSGWIELSHDDARERISKYFRNFRRKQSMKKAAK